MELNKWQDWVALYFVFGTLGFAIYGASALLRIRSRSMYDCIDDALFRPDLESIGSILMQGLWILIGWPISLVMLVLDYWHGRHERRSQVLQAKARVQQMMLPKEPICAQCGKEAWKHNVTLRRFLQGDYECEFGAKLAARLV